VIYTKGSNHNCIIEPCKSWGAFTRYIEIGDDLYPVRHVDVFANGYSLRYDRSHWFDELGMLAQMRYDKKKWEEWWGPSEETSSQEFEAVWRAGESSPVRSMQLDLELMSEYGHIPIWLARRGPETPGS
jgi:hypothetical protein